MSIGTSPEENQSSSLSRDNLSRENGRISALVRAVRNGFPNKEEEHTQAMAKAQAELEASRARAETAQGERGEEVKRAEMAEQEVERVRVEMEALMETSMETEEVQEKAIDTTTRWVRQRIEETGGRTLRIVGMENVPIGRVEGFSYERLMQVAVYFLIIDRAMARGH